MEVNFQTHGPFVLFYNFEDFTNMHKRNNILIHLVFRVLYDQFAMEAAKREENLIQIAIRRSLFNQDFNFGQEESVYGKETFSQIHMNRLLESNKVNS